MSQIHSDINELSSILLRFISLLRFLDVGVHLVLCGVEDLVSLAFSSGLDGLRALLEQVERLSLSPIEFGESCMILTG